MGAGGCWLGWRGSLELLRFVAENVARIADVLMSMSIVTRSGGKTVICSYRCTANIT